MAMRVPAFAQIDLTGSYQTRMYEDYIERGPGEFMGNFTGMPLTDEGRAKALLYTSNLPSIYERQCLRAVRRSPPVPTGGLPNLERARRGRQRPRLGHRRRQPRNDIRIWMDGRPHPSPNALHSAGGFATGKWEGDTLTARIDAPEDRVDPARRRHPGQRSHDHHHAPHAA